MKTQFGMSLEVNLKKDTWKFKMPNGYSTAGGEFAIMEKPLYDSLIQSLKDMAEIKWMEVTDENAEILIDKCGRAKEILKQLESI